MDAPHGLGAINAAFGDPRYLPPGKVSPAWEAAHMTLVRDFPLIPNGKLYVHKLIEAPLRQALEACAELGDGYHVHTIGCFAPRAQRGSWGFLLSTHTWGIAVDINAQQNPLITECNLEDARRRAPGARDIPDEWIAAFKAAGFFWGGDFSHRFDPQHFQFASGY
jgi:hypothetical protein